MRTNDKTAFSVCLIGGRSLEHQIFTQEGNSGRKESHLRICYEINRLLRRRFWLANGCIVQIHGAREKLLDKNCSKIYFLIDMQVSTTREITNCYSK